MVEQEELKKMVMTFRVSELQTLLGFAGQNKSGRKPELQSRALGLLRQTTGPIHNKICEIYKTIQQESHTSGSVPNSQGVTGPNSSALNNNSALSNATMMRYPQPHPTPHGQRPNLSHSSMINCNPTRAPYMHQTPYQSQQPRNVIPGQMYPYQTNQQVPAVTPTQYTPTYPPHPGVILKSLPFYDKLSDLVEPSSLITQVPRGRIGEASFSFRLTAQQANDIGMNRNLIANNRFEYGVQVQVRFCLLDTTAEQDDLFPPGIILKLNNKTCPLPNPIPTNTPGVEPKRPPRPVNVTGFVKISPTVKNDVTVSWTSDFSRGYVIGVYLVKKVIAKELLDRLRKNKVKEASFTSGIIQEKLKEDGDCDVATTVLRVSLICPLGRKRILNPCRPSTCTHLQCFDAYSYLEMNEVKPRWQCPVCNKPGLYQNLFIDSYFEDVLQSKNLPADHTEVKLLKDGSWSVLTPNDELHRANSPVTQMDSTVVIDADDENHSESRKNDQVVILTLSDSEDEDSKMNGIQKPIVPSNPSVEAMQQNSNSSLNLNVINLDSPSPPSSPANDTAIRAS